ncbi:MAG TPA: hypothetical protein ENI57_06690, partial [Ignavibacteria bacterium]|nr:hypothetical protein [Ignavibacteria bacterium]
MNKSTKSFFSNFLFLTLSLIFLFNSNTWGISKTIDKKQSINKTNSTTNAGAIVVKKWADDKKSAFSFSFDDAYVSQYINTRPILNQFGFKGTFFLLAGSIHDSVPEWRYGLWWQFLEMAQEGHEMAAHTMTHPHLRSMPVGDEQTPNTITYELYQSKILIEQKIGEKVISFAYPYTEHNAKVDNVTKKYFENGRAIGDVPNPSSLSGNAWYSLTSKQAEFNLPRNTPSDDLDELANYETFTQNSINNGQWTIFQGHEVLPFSEIAAALSQGSYLPISNQWLTALAQWIKNKSDNNDIWVETIGNVTRYIKERDNFTFNVVSSTANQIIISVNDGLDNTIYNYPLTTDIEVPNNWNNVTFTQDNVTKSLTTFTNNGVNYVRANVIPSGGNVTIQNSATLFTITSSAGSNGSITPLGVTSVNSGGSQAYTITPSSGYKIESITVDGNPETVTTNSGQTYTFTNVVVNHTISATFSVIQFTITSSAGSNGSITPLGVTSVNSGGSQAYTITPNTGYKIDSIKVDGTPVTVTTNSGQTYTFTNVTANHTITATFSVIQFTITSSAGSNG